MWSGQEQIGAGIGGPLGAAPHPAQRGFATHPRLAMALTTAAMASCLPTIALLDGGEGLLAAFIVTSLVVVVFSTAFAVHSTVKGHDQEYFFDYPVPYLGWPTWAPGHRDSVALLDAEAARRALNHTSKETAEEISKR